MADKLRKKPAYIEVIHDNTSFITVLVECRDRYTRNYDHKHIELLIEDEEEAWVEQITLVDNGDKCIPFTVVESCLKEGTQCYAFHCRYIVEASGREHKSAWLKTMVYISKHANSITHIEIV